MGRRLIPGSEKRMGWGENAEKEPVDQATKEGEVMAAAANEDTAALTGVGLDKTIIEQLDAAVGALRFGQANLTATLGQVKEAGRQWAIEEPLAYELRSELLHAVTYATRNISDAKTALKRIRQGTGHADMIQDLLALSELGKKYQTQLQAINFDIAALDKAAQKADSLGKLYAQAFLDRISKGPKDLRDRAFTYMRALMGEILDAAEYVFRKDDTRLNYYYSTYRSRRSGSAEVEPIPAAAAPA